MTRQKFTAAFVFSILLVLFVATMVSAQSAPPPAPQGVPCLRSVERLTTFKQYNEFVEDRALLATTTFTASWQRPGKSTRTVCCCFKLKRAQCLASCAPANSTLRRLRWPASMIFKDSSKRKRFAPWPEVFTTPISY